MKRFLCIFAVSLLAVSALALSPWTTGWGQKVTADTTDQRFTDFGVSLISVLNQGTNDVFALVNISTNDFATRVTAGTAVPIPGGEAFTFNADDNKSIYSICVKTTNATTDVSIAGF